MTDELKQQHSADVEMRKLIEDAAKLLGIQYHAIAGSSLYDVTGRVLFNPLDPERGDLMKVAEAAELVVNSENTWVRGRTDRLSVGVMYFSFIKGDYKSLALAILRAVSAVLKSRGGE